MSLRSPPISFEFRLLVECCRRAFSPRSDTLLERLSSVVDRRRFERLVRFHRVQGLVWNALRSAGGGVPRELAAGLAGDARDIAMTNVRIAAEAGALRQALDVAGLSALFVKGLTVGALAYPRPMLKMGWDIDLLVSEPDVTKAADVLRGRGYERTEPGPSVDLTAWHKRRKESVWARPEERLYVELHTRLADNRRLIPSIGLASPRREVAVAEGISLPTLGPDELFAYLCVHGASSLWFRLKWITDLAALLSKHDASGIERLYRRSQELGAWRAADQALLLADDLYGSLGGTSLGERLASDRASRQLAAAALRQLAGNRDGREPTETRFGTHAIHWTQLLLLPGTSFALGEARRQLRDALT